jgi:hypothetical protein
MKVANSNGLQKSACPVNTGATWWTVFFSLVDAYLLAKFGTG